MSVFVSELPLRFFFYWYCDHLDLHSFPTRRSSDLPRISMFCRQPLEGGVALVEMPAATTSGMAAMRARICSKNSARSFHATCVFSCTGIGTDMALCGS